MHGCMPGTFGRQGPQRIRLRLGPEHLVAAYQVLVVQLLCRLQARLLSATPATTSSAPKQLPCSSCCSRTAKEQSDPSATSVVRHGCSKRPQERSCICRAVQSTCTWLGAVGDTLGEAAGLAEGKLTKSLSTMPMPMERMTSTLPLGSAGWKSCSCSACRRVCGAQCGQSGFDSCCSCVSPTSSDGSAGLPACTLSCLQCR